MGIDPGVMTGYCKGTLEDNTLVLEPRQVTDDVDDVWRYLESLKPRHVVIEDFDFRQKSRAGLNLFPVQVIGIVRLWELMSITQTAVHLQKAATGKSYYTDNVLKQHDLYKRGVPHGLDALRHLLHWFTFGPGYQFNQKTRVILR